MSQIKSKPVFISTQHPFKKKQLIITTGLLINSLIFQVSYAAVTQSYGGTEGLVGDNILNNGFKYLLKNNNQEKNGVVVVNNNVPITFDTVLNIDYSNFAIPDFLVAGYGSFDKIDLNEDYSVTQIIGARNNKIILKQGDINGPIYAGLVQYTEKKSEINCSTDPVLCDANGVPITKKDVFQNLKIDNNTNIIVTEDNITHQINGDIIVGNNITNLQYDGLTASFNNYAYINDNYYLTDKNQIYINGDTTVKSILSGQNIINLQYGDLSVSPTMTNVATLTTNSYINGNTLIANKNKIFINDNTMVQNILAGQNTIRLQNGHLQPNKYIFNTVNAEVNAYSNKFIANENQISINGNTVTNNILAGQNVISLRYGSLGSRFVNAVANVSNNILIANDNQIDINGNTIAKNILAGNTSLNFQYYAKDSINDIPKINTWLTFLNINLENTSIETNRNKISLKGTSVISGDIKTGNINFFLARDSLICGDVGINSGRPCRKLISGSSPEYFFVNLKGTKAFSNNNSISIEGNHTFSNTKSVIYGGYLNYANNSDFIDDIHYYVDYTEKNDDKIYILPESYDVFTGNTLNYNNNIPIKVKEIGNFQNYNIVLNPNLANIDIALITANKISLGSNNDNMSADQVQKRIYNTVRAAVQTSKDLNDNTKNALPKIADDAMSPDYAISDNIKKAVLAANDISQSIKNLLATGKITSDIKVVGIQSGKVLENDTKFILMQADKGQLVGQGQGYLSRGIAQQGISLLYDVETSIDQSNDQVIAVIKASHDNPTGPKVNPQLKALLEGNLSGLMLLTRGADQLNGLTAQEQRGLVPFVISSGQHSRYNSGSHIKSNGALLTTGISVYDENVVWGAFVENGWDSYKTHNQFNNKQSVRGKGHNSFNGFGTFARYTFDNQLYLDGTLRIGRLKTSFETNDIVNVTTKEQARYNISGNYYGASLKGGYNWTWNNKNTVDLSAKYAWAGTESQNLTVAGDPMHFDALNSHRVLLSAENHYQFTPELKLTSGLGYEYEFDGRAKGTTYHAFGIDEASVKGSTGVVAAGLNYQPSQIKGLNINLKGNGYFGKREGGGALLEVNYEF